MSAADYVEYGTGRRGPTRQAALHFLFDPTVLRYLAVQTAEGWGGMRRSKGVAEIARELKLSETRVALGLKKMSQEGLCRPTSSRQLQIRYVITEAGEVRLGLRKSPRPTLRARLRSRLCR